MEDVCHLHSERALLSLLGMARIPSADAMGDWLRRIGRGGGGRKLLERLNAHVLGVTLGDRRSVSPSFRHGRQDHPSCPSGGAENAARSQDISRSGLRLHRPAVAGTVSGR